jgi:UDP-glucose 4-epimerase
MLMLKGNQEIALQQKLENKRILITGGLGMIGSTLAHALVKLGAKVSIVDACIEPYGANMFNLDGIRNKVQISITDIRDRESMKFLIKDQDIIFNFAAQVSHNDSIENPFLDADINYIGHLNVVENVRKYNPSVKILFSGSRLQFGQIEGIPVNEMHPLRPKTPYAFNKTVAENMYRFYSEVHELCCSVFRIANPYGIRSQMKHSKYSIVNYFIRQAMDNQTLTVYGDGNQLRDYIYVEDLVDAFLLVAIQDKPGCSIYNVGSSVGTRFKDMVNTVVQIVGKGKVEHVSWPDDYYNVETGNYVTDISKIVKEAKWKPLISLEEGIQKTFMYYQKYKKYYW